MKKMILILLTLSLLLTGCGAEATVETRIQVSLMNTEGCTVENNGCWIQPGEDAVFLLKMEEGLTLADTDYDGAYSARLLGDMLELRLKNVQHPERVNLELTREFATITYDANGGQGETVVKTYDRTKHLRPNTETGRELFRRDGYTLICWNTEPDGSGTRVGLGSRVTVEDSLTLYAQWEPWTEETAFQYMVTGYGTVTIRKYQGDHETLVIPERIAGYPVTTIYTLAFENSAAKQVILPYTLKQIAPDAFRGSAVETVVLFDKVEMISDDVFSQCEDLRTMYINAAEAPWGYEYRKESVYADKVDMLMLARGQKKMVFYGGCSVWYNLDGAMARDAFDGEYTVINMGLNGTVNSEAQMQILSPYLESGDVLIHTLELTSKPQLLMARTMGDGDDILWSGLEYNYDLFALVDLRTVKGELDSFQRYLDKKTGESSYRDVFRDSMGRLYLDEFGCIPFPRTETNETLTDMVRLDEGYVNQEAMELLDLYYSGWKNRGITVYATYACVNMDAVPEEQRGNAARMDSLVQDAFARMSGARMISKLEDFLFQNGDFYDTNYHLLTESAKRNTSVWLRDLKAQMIDDGLWEVGK